MKRHLILVMMILVFSITQPPVNTAQADRPLSDYPISTAENVSQLEQLKVLGKGYINDVIFSPDEQFVAMATTVGIWLYSIDNLETPIHLFGDYAINITYAMFTSDGNRLFGGTSNGWVYIWDVVNRNQIAELARIPNKISYFQLSKDEKHLYVMSNDLTIWNLEGNYLERTIRLDWGSSSGILSPDSEYLIKDIRMGESEWKTVVIDTLTGEILYFLDDDIYAPRFDETGTYILAIDAYSNADILIWDVQTGELLHQIGEHAIGYNYKGNFDC